VILSAFEEFGAIAQRLKGEIMKRTVMSKNKGEIPRLIYHDVVCG